MKKLNKQTQNKLKRYVDKLSDLEADFLLLMLEDRLDQESEASEIYLLEKQLKETNSTEEFKVIYEQLKELKNGTS